MTIRPFAVAPTASLGAARRALDAHGFRHLPVVDRGVVVGLILDSDVRTLATLGRLDLDETPVERVMRREPYTVAETTPLDEVVEAMAANKVDVAIVTNGSELVGIFTAVDACAALALVLRRAVA